MEAKIKSLNLNVKFIFIVFTTAFLNLAFANEPSPPVIGAVKIMNPPQIVTTITTCPDSPNCVSSLTSSPKHKMEAWTLNIDKKEALKQLKDEILKLPRTKLISEEADSLHFVFTTQILRFKDDVWFYFDKINKKIHFKSASRKGYSDFGANKKRIIKLYKQIGNKL